MSKHPPSQAKLLESSEEASSSSSSDEAVTDVEGYHSSSSESVAKDKSSDEVSEEEEEESEHSEEVVVESEEEEEFDDYGNKIERVPRVICGIRCGKKKKQKKYISLFRIYWINPSQIPLLILGVIAAFGQGVVFPGFSVIFGQIFKQFTGDASNIEANAAIIAYCFVGLGCYTTVCTFIYVSCFTLAGENVCKTLRAKLFESIMHKDVEFFDGHQTGELTARLSGDVLEVQGGISDKIGQIISHLAQVAMGLGIAFYYGWQLTLVLLGLSPLIAISGAIQATMMKVSAKNGKKAFIPATNLAEEAIGGFKTVLSFVMEDVLSRKYEEMLRKPTAIGRRRAFYLAGGLAFSFFVMFGTYALGFWYGGQLVANGDMDLGDLLIVFFSVVIGAMGLGQAAQLFPDVTKARAAATEIFDILRTPNNIDPHEGDGTRLEHLDGQIQFKNVQFAYPSRKNDPVFSNLELDIPPGEKVALVGPSGGGKSSVVALCMRFYDVLDGQLLIDGVDIREFDLRWLRSQIGLVAQEPILFSCSILENIMYGKQDASQEEVETAAKMANAHSFIMKLPQGYQTKIGEKGCRLSGGQKQRIAIARALLKDPKILLLDEATSALDTESESLVQEALNVLMEGRTSLIIAHRLATIRDAHTIAVMESGRIVERGTHKDLLKKKGVYSHLVDKQLSQKEVQSPPSTRKSPPTSKKSPPTTKKTKKKKKNSAKPEELDF